MNFRKIQPALAILFISSSAMSSQALNLLPHTEPSARIMFYPQIYRFDTNETNDLVYTIGWSGLFGSDVPLWGPYGSGGFHMQVGTIPSKTAQGNAGLDTYFFEFALDGRLQYPIWLSPGILNPYIHVSLGLWTPIKADLTTTTHTFERKYVFPLGFGPSGSTALGLSYFPFPLIGFFAEAGIWASYGVHSIKEKNKDDSFKHAGFASYLLWTSYLGFGVKLVI